MRRHKGEGVEEPPDPADPVDVFLAQPPFVEPEGIDEAALECDELLRGGSDVESIAEATRLRNQHHSDR
jgi:hypothetical protein